MAACCKRWMESLTLHNALNDSDRGNRLEKRDAENRDLDVMELFSSTQFTTQQPSLKLMRFVAQSFARSVSDEPTEGEHPATVNMC